MDLRAHQADLIENQLDVLSKTFLGLTVACARCHDHKFDAISTRDYFALYAILASSRFRQAALDPPAETAARVAALKALKGRARALLAKGWLVEVGSAGDQKSSISGLG